MCIFHLFLECVLISVTTSFSFRSFGQRIKIATNRLICVDRTIISFDRNWYCEFGTSPKSTHQLASKKKSSHQHRSDPIQLNKKPNQSWDQRHHRIRQPPKIMQQVMEMWIKTKVCAWNVNDFQCPKYQSVFKVLCIIQMQIIPQSIISRKINFALVFFREK